MLELFRPSLPQLSFRQALMADADTMSYNAAWGGPIPFPEETWAAWYRHWVEAPASERFYRYLYDPAGRRFVGEVSYHFDERLNLFLCGVVVLAAYRNRGFGTAGLRLLCEAAKGAGVTELYDDIAADNPSLSLFLKNGFSIADRTDDVVLVKKTL